MIRPQELLRTVCSLMLLLAASPQAGASAIGLPSQFGKVEVSQVIAGSGAATAISTTLEPLDLRVGSASLEASLRTDFPPAASALRGVTGTIFVSANSVLVTKSNAAAVFDYDFRLSQPARIIFLRFDAGIEPGNEASFLLEREGLPVFGSTGEQLLLNQGTLAPGPYRLSVGAAAFANAEIARRFTASQANFALVYFSIPEPGTGGLASVLLAGLWLRPRRRTGG